MIIRAIFGLVYLKLYFLRFVRIVITK